MIIANLRESCMYTGEKKGRSIWVEKWVCFWCKSVFNVFPPTTPSSRPHPRHFLIYQCFIFFDHISKFFLSSLSLVRFSIFKFAPSTKKTIRTLSTPRLFDTQEY